MSSMSFSKTCQFRVIDFAYRCFDRGWLFFAYLLSAYLFYLPFIPFWRDSFQEDNGMVVMAATTMVFLSPIVLPFVLGMMGIMLFVGTYEVHPVLALGIMFLPLLYYAIVLMVSVLIIRALAEWMRRWLSGKAMVYIKGNL